MLCNEPMRGVSFELDDLKLHPSREHRGVAQMMPATRRAMMAGQLTAKPVLLEPVFLVEVQVRTDITISG